MRKMELVAWWVARRGVGGCSGEQPYTGGRYDSYDSYCSYFSYFSYFSYCSYCSSLAFALI